MHNGEDGQSDSASSRSRPRNSGLLAWLRIARYLMGAGTLVIAPMAVPAFWETASAAVPPGVWLMGTKVAIQIFDCSGLPCGRVISLTAPLNAQGLLKRDTNKADPALRQRQLRGPTIIWNRHAAGPNRWEGGWFYNPDDGKTYRTSTALKSADVIVARMYSGLPIFGETKTLIRIPEGTSEGWC
jgi:Uncharacterized protein conserved in bacteria (DUF2147)